MLGSFSCLEEDFLPSHISLFLLLKIALVNVTEDEILMEKCWAHKMLDIWFMVSGTTIMFDIYFDREVRVLRGWEVRGLSASDRELRGLSVEFPPHTSPILGSESGELWKLCWHRVSKQEWGSSTQTPTSWLLVFQMVRISFMIARMSRKFLQTLLVSISLLAWVSQSYVLLGFK